MRQHRSPYTRAASLAVTLALGVALGSGPAQAGDDMELNVSAIVLPRTACSFAGATGEGARTTFRCNGSDAATTYRVRADRGLRATSATVARGETGTLPMTASDTGVLTVDL